MSKISCIKCWVKLLQLITWMAVVCGVNSQKFFMAKDLANGVKKNSQRAAVENWAQSLTDYDYNATEWARTMRKQPQNFFDAYAIKLSKMFKQYGATVNFVLVGACDGTHDNTIRDRYLPNEHWSGLFVEPVSTNYKDLVSFLQEHKVSNRSDTIQAAVTDSCSSSTVSVRYSTLEDTDPNASHWRRRQIGGIASDKPSGIDKKKWEIEDVACMTPNDIKKEWNKMTQKKSIAIDSKKSNKKRIHVLKIDAEGQDFKVLMGFLDDEVPVSELPLIINYEGKMMGEKLVDAKDRMEARGYVVSEGNTNDGFALLRGDEILGTSKSANVIYLSGI